MLLGLLNQSAQKVDGSFTNELKNHLFVDHSPKRQSQFGGDLVARNIQRGRDHGIPDYNTFRKICNLPVIRSWKQGPAEIRLEMWRRLETLYTSVDEIDLYPAAIAETPVDSDALLGPTFSCLIGLQFHNLKYGDRYFYSHHSTSLNYLNGYMRQMETRTLSDIICDNTNIKEVQQRALESPSARNPTQECHRPSPVKQPPVADDPLLDDPLSAPRTLEADGPHLNIDLLENNGGEPQGGDGRFTLHEGIDIGTEIPLPTRPVVPATLRPVDPASQRPSAVDPITVQTVVETINNQQQQQQIQLQQQKQQQIQQHQHHQQHQQQQIQPQQQQNQQLKTTQHQQHQHQHQHPQQHQNQQQQQPRSRVPKSGDFFSTNGGSVRPPFLPGAVFRPPSKETSFFDGFVSRRRQPKHFVFPNQNVTRHNNSPRRFIEVFGEEDAIKDP